MDHDSINSLLFYAVVYLIIFLATLTDLAKEYQFRKKAKKWHGITTGVITEIKQDYYYDKFKKIWLEYPVITYTAGSERYCLEYLRGKKKLDYYQIDEKISLLYNRDNPKEFIFSNEFSRISYCAMQIFMLALLIFFLFLSGKGFVEYYLGTHELLFEEETWTDLQESFAPYSGIHFYSTSDDTILNLNSKMEEVIGHFQQVNEMIEKKRGRKNYDTYKSRYHQSAMAVSRSLADFYSQIAGDFLEECGMKGAKENIYQSAYEGFLEKVCPSIAEESAPYSMEELSFLLNFAAKLGNNKYVSQDEPEENIGLSLAVCYAKLYAAIDTLSYGEPLMEIVENCYPGYIIFYEEQVDNYLMYCRKVYGAEEYPPLNREAVYAVYQYTAA